jgi:hypothetical protein
VFLLLLVIGLTGLVVMALPAFMGQAHGGHGHPLSGHHGHALGHPHAPAANVGHHQVGEVQAAHGAQAVFPAAATVLAAGSRRMRFIPSPRTVCSLLALYGGFGNALERAFHLSALLAAALALIPTVLVDRFAVTPLWNLLFRFHAQPSSPLDELIYSEARAVVTFRNGRGLISTVRDGRAIQLMGELPHAARGVEQVNVGDLLRIEGVDVRRERVTVTRVRQ